jgi:hypothetical protein
MPAALQGAAVETQRDAPLPLASRTVREPGWSTVESASGLVPASQLGGQPR